MSSTIELRTAISAILPVVTDESTLRRVLTMLAAAAASPGTPSGVRATPAYLQTKRKRIAAGTKLIPPEHLAAAFALRDRFGKTEAARLLSLTHQTFHGLLKSEGRCFPQTAAAITDALAKMSPADYAAVETPAEESARDGFDLLIDAAEHDAAITGALRD
jgi:hypothetical protein